ncbi:conserved Plasmodium protein, unknown function [Plasmodium vinckei lentum]|uniref:Uncharacterized protein n=1 Tax=Plasmodium vinckei lentum TaxID=138297 RepID=A0A6V7S7I8_PLAVN|nr:conserved Plasmodium protein, unknown function [Plasmodium vinckei lentum]
MNTMSAMSVKVDNRYIIKKKENNNNSCDHLNVDINHIIKDIYGFNHSKKRSAHYISDDTISNNNHDIITNLYKKIKIQDCNNVIKHESPDNKSEYDDSISPIFDIHEENKNDINNNKTSPTPNSNTHSDNYNYSKSELNRKSIKNNRNIIDNSDNKKRQCNGYTHSFTNEQAENNLSKKFEILIDNVLERISTCNEINQAKKIMIPMISNFIQNNFQTKENSEESDKINKIENNVLQKEKKVLINAVKTQYQKIINLQKVVDSQKMELKKKNEELNKIKAKVHEYFYDLNNPNKRVFNILTPDVY